MHGLATRFPLRLGTCLGLLATCALTACHSTNRGLTLPKQAGPVPVNSPRQPTAAEQAFWDQLAPARVIYIGETHNSNSDHEYQWDVLKGLKARGVRCTICWEMFDYTQQGLLDQWGARQLPTEALLQRTDFQSHWGTLSVLYEKILRWSLAEGVPSLAINAPASVSRKLAQGQSLDADERATLPSGFRPLPGGYEHFSEQMAGSPHAGAETRNLFQAQLLWEQTMASRIVEYLAAHPDEKLIVLVGRGHVDGGFGVPAFVMQKTDAPQLVVYPGGLPAGGNSGGGHLATATGGVRPGNS